MPEYYPDLDTDPLSNTPNRHKLDKGLFFPWRWLYSLLSVYYTASSIVVLNLWVVSPLEVTYQISCIADIYIMVQYSSKMTLMK